MPSPPPLPAAPSPEHRTTSPPDLPARGGARVPEDAPGPCSRPLPGVPTDTVPTGEPPLAIPEQPETARFEAAVDVGDEWSRDESRGRVNQVVVFTTSTVVHVVILLAFSLMGARNERSPVHLPLQISTAMDEFEVDLEHPEAVALDPVEPSHQLDERRDVEMQSVVVFAGPDEASIRVDPIPDLGDQGAIGEFAPDPNFGRPSLAESDYVMKLGAGDEDGDFVLEGDGADVDFYGVKATGRRFVFVTDCSGSMDGQPLVRLKEQLRASIDGLPKEIEFFIVFFNEGAIPMPAPRCVRATPANTARYLAWVDAILAGGGTDPSRAMIAALGLKPNAIFLLTDGEFVAEPTLQAILHLNADRRVQINTIAIGNHLAEPTLQRIAAEHRGAYRFVDP